MSPKICHFLTVGLIMTMIGIVLTEKNVCTLPQEIGPCEANIPSWYYNKETKACEKFTYGGCEGNGNRFETQQACELRCGKKDVCKLPAETGMCRGSFPKWFYNFKAKACQMFIYGGCGGNMNRFDSQDECEKICNKKDCTEGIVGCKKNPCDGARCAKDPDAVCKPDYCGGCFARWYKRGGKVTECSFKGKKHCRPEDIVRCYGNPCAVNICDVQGAEICVPNYCWGCRTEWFKLGGPVPQCDTEEKMKK